MELEHGLHKSRLKGRLFESDAEPEASPEQPRGKRPRWRLPLVIVFIVIVVLGGGVLGYTHILHAPSTAQQTSQYNQYKWCVSTGAPLTGLPGGADTELESLHVIAPDNIWAIGTTSRGNYGNGTAQYTSFFEHWDGARWSMVPGADASTLLNDLTSRIPGNSNKEIFISQLAVLSTDNIWAVGKVAIHQIDAGETGGHTLVEHWDGHQWKVVPSPDEFAQGSNVLNSIAAVSADDIWTLGSAFPTTPSGGGENLGTPLFEHWDGTRWNIVQVPASFQPDTFYALSAISVNDIWAVGSGPALPVSGQVPLAARWNGQQWSQVALPNSLGLGYLDGMTALSAHNIWAIGQVTTNTNDLSANAPLFMVHWDGQRWHDAKNEKGLVAGSEMMGMAVNGANDIWVAGFVGDPSSGASPLLEYWDGKHWNNLNLSSLHVMGNGALYAIAISGKNIWLAGEQDNPTTNVMEPLLATTC